MKKPSPQPPKRIGSFILGRTREATECCDCRGRIDKGEEAYRSRTNSDLGRRIHVKCMELRQQLRSRRAA